MLVTVARPSVAPLQMEALRKTLGKFGIVELVRTGRISLKRGDRMFDTGSWNPRCVGSCPGRALPLAPLPQRVALHHGASHPTTGPPARRAQSWHGSHAPGVFLCKASQRVDGARMPSRRRPPPRLSANARAQSVPVPPCYHLRPLSCLRRVATRPHVAVEQPPIQSGEGDVYDAANVLDAGAAQGCGGGAPKPGRP